MPHRAGRSSGPGVLQRGHGGRQAGPEGVRQATSHPPPRRRAPPRDPRAG